jgi:hypothetical protein
MEAMIKLCKKCGKNEVEQIDDWVSNYCGHCNDRLIEQANEDREWRYYHPPLTDEENN